jgi:hypothetical protein
MIDMQVNRELQGEVVARAACGLPWETALGGLDQAEFPMLAALDPYGDAVFNHQQIPALLRELDQLPPERGGMWVGEVRTLCELVLQRRPHHYLLFIGDLCRTALRFSGAGLVALVLTYSSEVQRPTPAIPDIGHNPHAAYAGLRPAEQRRAASSGRRGSAGYARDIRGMILDDVAGGARRKPR